MLWSISGLDQPSNYISILYGKVCGLRTEEFSGNVTCVIYSMYPEHSLPSPCSCTPLYVITYTPFYTFDMLSALCATRHPAPIQHKFINAFTSFDL